MSTFPKIEQQFRDRFGCAPEIPFPFDPDSWAKILKQCLDENSARAYRAALEYEKELLGDGEW